MPAVDAVPPQDIETEAACIASALLNREALFQVTEILQAEDFYLEKHRIIFEKILELERKGLPIDLTTLRQKLMDHDQFDQVGGDPSLVDLYQAVSTSANARYYAERVRELALRRHMIQVATDAVTRSYDTKLETRDLLDQIESSIFSITEKKYTSNYEPLSLILERTRQDIEDWYRTKKVVTGIGSGFRELDELLTGFHPSELIIIASRPGMGKTALALNMINHVALKEKKAALYFSLEMPAEQLGMRLICVEAMVDSQLLRTGRISQDDYRNIDMAINRLGQSPLYIDDTPSVNILEIRAKARRLAARESLGLVVVDYLQLVSAIERRMDRHLQIGEISRFLKQLARELSIPVIALSQLSRAVEQRTDQRPTLADLRESGSIEQDADVVIFLYREEKVKRDSEKKGIAELMIAKQRSGPVGNIELFFWEKFTKFGNLDKTHSYEEAIPAHELE